MSQNQGVVGIGPFSTVTDIKKRLTEGGISHAANDCIADNLTPTDLAAIEGEVADRFEDVLDALVIARDHNTEGTAKRVAKMFVRELFQGRYQCRPAMTDFPNSKKLDELYTVGPITVRSTCAHHFCPIEGQAWCGVVPGERIIGLSKFARLANWVLSRPQIQEEAVVQLADELEDLIKPQGLGVVIRCRHACMTMRGVNEHETTMTTSVMRGLFKLDSKARSEFLAIIDGQRF